MVNVESMGFRFVVRVFDGEGLGSVVDVGGNSIVLEVVGLFEELEMEGIGNLVFLIFFFRKFFFLVKGGILDGL